MNGRMVPSFFETSDAVYFPGGASRRIGSSVIAPVVQRYLMLVISDGDTCAVIRPSLATKDDASTTSYPTIVGNDDGFIFLP